MDTADQNGELPLLLPLRREVSATFLSSDCSLFIISNQTVAQRAAGLFSIKLKCGRRLSCNSVELFRDRSPHICYEFFNIST